ncbi:hypothetical protein PV350_23580 [Streptomyces sp. PA03-6a]|nr:hypothetical protein [Streptomyces sp. PA03-6a]
MSDTIDIASLNASQSGIDGVGEYLTGLQEAVGSARDGSDILDRLIANTSGEQPTASVPGQRAEETPAGKRGPQRGIAMLSCDDVYARKGDQMGAAELFVEDADGGYPLRWNAKSERFYHYAEGCWREDDKSKTTLGRLVDTLGRKVTNLVDLDIARMRAQLQGGGSDDEDGGTVNIKLLEELIKIRPNWYKTYRSAGGRAGIIDLIRTSVEPVETEQMDADPHLLNFLNGTFDVRTGELREADPEDYLTHRIEQTFTPHLADKPLEEVAPLFHGLLRRACAAPGEVAEETAKGRVEAVVRGLGSMISGECGDKAMLVFEGGTDIGKTVILEMIQTLLGQQLATSSKPNLLIKTRGDKHDATEYALKGRRFVLVNEFTAQMTLDEGQTLRLINPGGATLTVRRLGQQEEIIIITWTIAITTNELPRARVTPQVLGRLVIYPMSKIPIPKDEQDKTLRRRILAEEGDAVLAHLTRWWREWYLASEEGGRGLIVTGEMQQALEEFKEDNSTLADQFREEMTVVEPMAEIRVTDLWQSYVAWHQLQHPNEDLKYGVNRKQFYAEVLSWPGVQPVYKNNGVRADGTQKQSLVGVRGIRVQKTPYGI